MEMPKAEMAKAVNSHIRHRFIIPLRSEVYSQMSSGLAKEFADKVFEPLHDSVAEGFSVSMEYLLVEGLLEDQLDLYLGV